MMTMEQAKAAYTRAVEAFLRGDGDAVQRCKQALADLNAVRAREQVRTVPSRERFSAR